MQLVRRISVIRKYQEATPLESAGWRYPQCGRFNQSGEDAYNEWYYKLFPEEDPVILAQMSQLPMYE